MNASITYDFSDQTAIVTGGTRGIGGAVSRCLLEAGATVYAIYASNTQTAEKFRQSLGTLSERLHLVQLDVSDADAAKAFFDSLNDTPIHILVNSAGMRKDGVTAMLSQQDWNRVLEVNLTGTFIMTKLAILNMMRQRYGRIINLTSPSGQIGIEGQANYAASKAGIVALTKSAARETARRSITINAISPGFIMTDFISELPPEQLEQYRKSVPAKKFGTPEEVAHAILFLASPEASYITGSVLTVAGGL